MNKKYSEAIQKYNQEARAQILIMKRVKEKDCPYFIVTKSMEDTFTQEVIKSIEECTKGSKNQIFFKVWNILLDGGYKPQTTKKQQVKFNLSSVDKKAQDANEFLQYVSRVGLFFPRAHFIWAYEQGIIRPLFKTGNVIRFSPFQFFILDLINDYKLQSLEYPNPMVHPDGETIIKDQPLNWMEYIELNKGNIIDLADRWDPVAHMLMYIDRLWQEIRYETLSILLRNKSLTEPQKRYHAKMVFKDIERCEASKFAEKIAQKFPKISDESIETWAYSRLPAEAIKHNPLLKVDIQNLFEIQDFEYAKKQSTTIFRKNQPIQISKCYINTIRLLLFYLKNRGRKTEELDLIFKDARKNPIRLCKGCKEPIPKEDQKGVKPRTLCTKDSCNKDYHKKKAKERRKMQKK